MKRVLSALLTLGMIVLLCACGAKAPEPAAIPDVTAIPAPTAVPATATPEPTAAPTATPVVLTPSPEPRWVRGETRTDYSVLTGTSRGAEALTIWLLGEGRELLASFCPQDLEESMFLPAGGLDRTGETVSPAAEDTRDLILAADERLAECGLLAVLIPAFEDRDGYQVEIFTGSGETLQELAREADLAILAEEEALPLRREGVFFSYWSLASTYYSLEYTF